MWIFWHDWWPWYVAGWAAFTAAVGVLVGVLKRRSRSRPKPCIPISCPPAEEVSINVTIIRCPHCGSSPYAVPSMWEQHDRHEWFCPEHGLVFVSVRHADGRVELEDA